MEYWKYQGFFFNTKRDLFSNICWRKTAGEFHNKFDKFAVKLFSGKETVGHLPHEYSRIAFHLWWINCCWSDRPSAELRFLAEWFMCSRKATLNWLKALLMKDLNVSLCLMWTKTTNIEATKLAKAMINAYCGII